MPPDGPPADSLETWLARSAPRNLCVVGVGNRLRGDDGVGSWVAGRLGPRVPVPVIDAGVAPENYLEKIAASRPEAVLVIDAADFGGRPGDVRFAAAAEASGGGLSTHALSLDLFARYLEQRAGAAVFLVAVQPASVGWEENLSPDVAAAGERLLELLAKHLPRGRP